MARQIETDVLVIGAGGAGMRAAYDAHLAGAKVFLAVKGRFGALGVRGGGATGSSNSEVGFIRPVGRPQDRPEDVRVEPDQVYEDVIQCGLGMADHRLVRVLVENAHEARQVLDSLGMVPGFGEGHGVRNHGVPIMAALQSAISRADIVVRERLAVSDLLTKNGACAGAVAIDELNGDVLTIKAAATVIATGGLGNAYSRNFHPSDVTGDGYAMGYEAGAELFNMEFHQVFLGTRYPNINLISTGWMLKSHPRITNGLGEEFMARYVPAGGTVEDCLDQRSSHGPYSTRDKYSRYVDYAIMSEVKAGRGSPHGGAFFHLHERKVNIPRGALEFMHYRGIYPEKEPLEIGPGHHCCDGGFRIDENAETTVPGLFACGEAATGMHGADRMSGHMLLASQVFGMRAGRAAAKRAKGLGAVALDAQQAAALASGLAWPRAGSLNVDELALAMGELAYGELLVGRTAEGMKRALGELARMRDEDLPRLAITSPDDVVRAVEVRNGLRALEIVARAALEREESRGGHFRQDFLAQDDANWLKAIVVAKEGGRLVTRTWAVDPAWKPRAGDMHRRRW